MSDTKLQDKATDTTSGATQDSTAGEAQQRLSNESSTTTADLKSDKNSQTEFQLPHLELLQKASESGKDLWSPASKAFKDTCKLYEQAIEKSAGPTLSEVQKMNPDLALKTLKAMQSEEHAPALSRLKYAEFLSAVGEKTNNPTLRQKALDQLNSVEKVDRLMFTCEPNMVGARRQLESGQWIDPKTASSFALTQVAIDRLGVKQSFLEYAANGFTGPSDSAKKLAVEGLAHGLNFHPEFARQMIKNAQKESSTGGAALLHSALKDAEVEAGKMALKAKTQAKN